jgi:carotenoid cleavage dioxygenase
MYYVADATGALISAEPVEVGASTMMHDFAITGRDVVFWEQPVLFDLELAVEMVADPDSDVMPFAWTPSYGSRIGVMPLGGPTSEIRWVEIDNCYVFHGINAFRDGDDVVVDVCRMDKVFDGSALGPPPKMHRWRVNTGAPALTFRDETLTDRAADLPSIDRRRAGLDYRHSWRVEVDDEPGSVDFYGVVHYDTQTQHEDRWDPGAGRSSGEWLFVPDGHDEGDGFVLTYVHDKATELTDLVVLDARDVAAGPVGSVTLPQRVPYGFHAAWVPAAEI